jgi:enterochelin esterase-like enzyme
LVKVDLPEIKWGLMLLASMLLGACIQSGGSSTVIEPISVSTATATAFPVLKVTPEVPQPTMHSGEGSEELTAVQQVCLEHKGTLEKTSYSSAVLSEELEVRVYLPPCYDIHDRDYPAVYFFHGSPPGSADWVSLGVLDVLEEGMAEGGYPPAILVFPLQPDAIFIWSDGGPGSYEEEFFLGVLPHIESAYRVRSQGSARAVAGISRGGVWSLEISLSHPDDFAAVAALSPALQYNDPRPQYDPFEIIQNMDRGPQRMLLMAGDQDWARDETEALAAIMEEYGRPVVLRIIPGDHQASLWQNAMDSVLTFLLSDWFLMVP